MAPTTLVGQVTTTSPYGREPGALQGKPIRVAEMLATAGRRSLLYRAGCRCTTYGECYQGQKGHHERLFRTQIEGKGFHAGGGPLHLSRRTGDMSPTEVAFNWLKENMIPALSFGREPRRSEKVMSARDYIAPDSAARVCSSWPASFSHMPDLNEE